MKLQAKYRSFVMMELHILMRHYVSHQNVEYANGGKEWFFNGERHREDSPAVEYADGYKAWYLNGKRHRTDGPAIEHTNGTKEYWINGNRVRFFRLRKALNSFLRYILTIYYFLNI